MAHEIEEAGVNLKVLNQNVDTSTAAGRAFFRMLAVFAAFEADVHRKRQMGGIGVEPAKIARELGIARSSVYRLFVAAASRPAFG